MRKRGAWFATCANATCCGSWVGDGLADLGRHGAGQCGAARVLTPWGRYMVALDGGYVTYPLIVRAEQVCNLLLN